jgi:hypothetical protein
VVDKKMINVRLSPEVWKRAKATAGERGMTLERWVTDALEAHIAAQRGGGSENGAAPAPGGAGGSEVADLAWRVSALEQAIDYLASQIGAGFPDRTGGGAEAAADSTDEQSG